MTVKRLVKALGRGTVVLDTSTLIAYLRGGESVSEAATAIIDGSVRSGMNPAVVSTVTVAELMVRPLTVSAQSAASLTSFLLGFPGLEIRSVDFLVAAEAARIRAQTRASTPDSLIAATATLTRSEWLVTNDRDLRDRLAGFDWQTEVLLLSDLATR